MAVMGRAARVLNLRGSMMQIGLLGIVRSTVSCCAEPRNTQTPTRVTQITDAVVGLPHSTVERLIADQGLLRPQNS